MEERLEVRMKSTAEKETKLRSRYGVLLSAPNLSSTTFTGRLFPAPSIRKYAPNRGLATSHIWQKLGAMS